MSSIDIYNVEERIVLDTSEEVPTYLLMGKNRRYIKISENAYQLLTNVYKGITFDAIARNISQKQGKPVPTEQVETAYRNLVDRIRVIENGTEKKGFGFWFYFPLISEYFVDIIASKCTWVFHKVASIVFGVLIISMLCSLWLYRLPSAQVGGSAFVYAYFLFLSSLIVHEFGHASACLRYGAKPSDIGFGVYMIYPVFYSDVSSAWQLKRWQRAVVDLGGMFFQLIFGVLCIAIYLSTGWISAYVAVVMIIYSCIFSLNPFFKFDGYWLVSDVFGITNLGEQIWKILRYMINALLRRDNRPLPWSRKAVAVLLVYATLAIFFWIFAVVYALPIIGGVLQSYPGQVEHLIQALTQHTPLPTADLVVQTLVVTVVLISSLIVSIRACYLLLRSRLRGAAGLQH